MEQSEQLEFGVYKEFEIIQKIGKGTYGIVYKAQQKRNKKVVAIKQIIDAFQNLIDAKRTYRELNYLLQLEHPTIVRLQYLLPVLKKSGQEKPSTTRLAPPQLEIRGCNTDKLAENFHNQPRHVYAVFEYVETDLRLALKKCSEMQSIQRKFIGYQLIQGIAYLHRSGLVHRDIKPENILINCNKLEIKICDFGMARLQASSSLANDGVLTEYVASRWYRPPEALLGISTCQPSIDLWSIGCVLAELALKTPLFQGKSTLDQLELIFRSIGMPSSSQISNLQSEESRYVLKNFSFSRKAKFRPLQDLLGMCSNAEIDLIIHFLSFDPNDRISAEQALKHEYFDEVRGINEELEAYSKAKTDLCDLSQGTHQKGQRIKLAIEDYRAFVDQLEKFADRSTNRSMHMNRSGGMLRQAYAAMSNRDHEGDKEKSTKESNFVTEHKHKFLSKTHQSLHKVREESKQGSNHVDCNKNLKNKRSSSKNISRKQKNLPSNLDIQSSKSIKLKSKHKIEAVSKKAKGNLDMTKKVNKNAQNQGSFKLLKSKSKSKDGFAFNKGKLVGDNSVHSFNSPSKVLDNISIISNNSKNSSIRSKSRVKSASRERKILKETPLKLQKDLFLKKVTKQPLNLNKSTLIKCKSSNHVNHFKK